MDITPVGNENPTQAYQVGAGNDTVHKHKPGKGKITRVKTGCLTCKFRRVKCDEARPHCSRCIRFGINCDGYPDPAKRPTPQPFRPTGHRPIFPKKSQHAAEVLFLPPIRIIRPGSQFEDELEGRYFQMYLEKSARQLRGPFKNSLWDRLIPQASETEPFVRQITVAIGALYQMSKDAKRDNEMPSTRYKTLEYTYALQQYQKALQGMRAAIANGEHDIRKALIACILVFCFESLQGRLGPAVMHAQSGLMLLHQWVKVHLVPQVPPFMSQQWRRYGIDEDIMDAFSALDLHVLFFLDRRPMVVRKCLITAGNTHIQKMPAKFDSLQEARFFWVLIMRRNCHFVRLALEASKLTELCGPWNEDSETPWDGDANMMPGDGVFGTPYNPDLTLLGDYNLYQEDISRWNRASASLFECLQQRGTVKEKIIAALLQIHSFTSYIMLKGVFVVKETDYDALLPEFRTMLSLVQFVLPHLIASAEWLVLYQFELGIVPSLFLLGLRCRDNVTRTEALDLMLSAVYREGIWDLAAAGRIVSWIVGIEEEGRDENGYIPECKRVFLSACHLDLLNRWAVLAGTQRGLNGLVFRKERIFF
ncbi:hypothetical protein DL98DRAFT_522093 [Cadophora sp. DSE1049]|nr:hypothetical protein DL98DRAFT_522093 [Cadophora sp. DSE1049]